MLASNLALFAPSNICTHDKHDRRRSRERHYHSDRGMAAVVIEKSLPQRASWEANTDESRAVDTREFMWPHVRTPLRILKNNGRTLSRADRSCTNKGAESQSTVTSLQVCLPIKGTCKRRHPWDIPVGHFLCHWPLAQPHNLPSLISCSVAFTKDSFSYCWAPE